MIMNRISIVFMLAFTVFSVFGQRDLQKEVDFVKAASGRYYWGEGTGKNLTEADAAAMGMLSEQISVSVEKQFISQTNETEQEHKERVETSIKTYSHATFQGDNKAKRIVLASEPKCKVFRYMEISSADGIFNERKQKAIDYSESGVVLLNKLQIADALRYLYWAQQLLSTVPNYHAVKHDGDVMPLHLWIDMKIKEALLGIDITIVDVEVDGEKATFQLSVKYKGQNVANFDYSYWVGDDWTNPVSARNGIGIIDLHSAYQGKTVNIKAEYFLLSQSNIDAETKRVVELVSHKEYVEGKYKVPIDSSIAAKLNRDVKNTAKSGNERDEVVVSNDVFSDGSAPDVKKHGAAEKGAKTENDKTIAIDTKRCEQYANTVKRIENAIRSRQYDAVRDAFTSEGWDIFNKIIRYGNAKVIGSVGSYSFAALNGAVMCRSIPMSFEFKNNRSTFVENVVFILDDSGRINNVQFALSQYAIDDLNDKNKDRWTDDVTLSIIDFLENYKTAYALKKLDYIEGVFSNDALIIVGNVLKVPAKPESFSKDYQQIRYDTMTKATYVDRMRRVFASNEYVNINFTQNDIVHAAKYGNVFGIKIRQEYYSTNYGDTGYLFLMVDLNNVKEPRIKIRTWQPISTNKSDIIDENWFR